MANHLTFEDIKTAIKRLSKQFTGAKDTMLEHMINMVYLTEIMSDEGLDPFFWLIQLDVSRRSVAPATLNGITAANPGLFSTPTAHGLSVGDVVEFADTVGMTQLNGMLAQVTTVPTTTTFYTNLSTLGYDAYTSGGRIIHRGITLAHEADDVLYASWNNDREAMTPLTPEVMESSTDYHNKGNTGTPAHFTFGKTFTNAGAVTDQIIWTDGADQSMLLRYWYRQPITRLASDGDVPLLPPRFHDAIVAGVISRVVEADNNSNVGVEKASLWPAIYTSHLEAIRTYNERYWRNVEKQQKVIPYML